MKISTTLGISRIVNNRFTPFTIEELISEYPKLRQKYKSVSVISRGKNWGYGCHAPNADEDLLIDLSECHRILEFDDYHGTITVEPGVSYGQMAQFLKEQGDKWITPVHGGGSDGSVMGNALERGYGLTPYTDHFGAVISLSALLENGEVYERSLKVLGQEKLDKLFKYGLGPYYDGLFTQSGIGIVTQMTMKLAPKPSYVEVFYYYLKNENEFAEAVEAIKKSKRDLGAVLGGINLMNRERCLSMVMDYPIEKVRSGEALSDEEIHNFSRRYHIDSWLVVGTLYGGKGLVKEAKKQIKKNFSRIHKRSFYFNSSNKPFYERCEKLASFLGASALSKALQTMIQAYEVLLGTPNNVALRLAYWKNENKELVKQENLNPNRDECGLIWYAPLVEMKSDRVLAYTEFLKASAKKFGMNSLITLTTIDDLCFDSTVPILFNRKNEKDREKAIAYYEYLFAEGAKLGFFPYRINIETQRKMNIQNPFFKIPSVNPNRYK